MNNEQKLLSAYEDVVWMAIRYAHGRSTYAPSMVRQSIEKIQEIYPHWRPKKDHVICPRNPKNKENSILDSDYLDDLFLNTKENSHE